MDKFITCIIELLKRKARNFASLTTDVREQTGADFEQAMDAVKEACRKGLIAKGTDGIHHLISSSLATGSGTISADTSEAVVEAEE